MVDNKRDMIIENEIKGLVKKGISIVCLRISGLVNGKQKPEFCQYSLEDPLDSKDMDIIVKDPTEVIMKNRNFLLDLIKHGFDEKKLPKFFLNYYGLRVNKLGVVMPELREKFYSLFNDKLTIWLKANNFKEDSVVGMLKYWECDGSGIKVVLGVVDKKFRKNVDYGIRALTSLCKNPVITDKAKNKLAKERNELLKIKEFFGGPRVFKQPIHQDEKGATLEAKSWTQMRGFQVVKAYNYIKALMEETNKEMVLISLSHKEYRDKDVFALICEFLNQPGNKFDRYTVGDIKNLYFNNVGYSSKV